MTFKRGGLADLLHEFNRLHTRKFLLEARMGDVFAWRQQCEGDFNRHRPALLYENIPGDFPNLQDRFLDLRPFLEEINPFTGETWNASFRPEALRPLRLTTRNSQPAYSLVIDFSAPALNYNIDVLEALGVPLPIRTWSEFEACLEICQRADYAWPLALFNLPPTNGIDYFVRGIQTMVMRPLLDRLDRDRDGIVGDDDWRGGLERRNFTEQSFPYVESLKILKRLSRHFLWYANRYDSIHVKPFYFSRRPQSLFRAGDFRRVRADMELYGTVVNGRRLFPFREGAMHLPEITRETSSLASGPAPTPFTPSLCISVAREGKSGKEVETGVRFLQFLTTQRNQTFFTRWSYTVSATRGVPLPPVLDKRSVVFRQASVTYMGLSPEGRAIWNEAVRRFIEPTGELKDMLVATRRAIELDRKWMRVSL